MDENFNSENQDEERLKAEREGFEFLDPALEQTYQKTFGHLTTKETIVEILRWLAVLPAAAAGGLLANLIAVLFNSSGCTGGMIDPDNSVFDKLLVVIISSFAFGFATVVAGSKTAPRFHTPVAVVLGIIVVFFSGVAMPYSSGWDIARIIIGIVGVTGGGYAIYRDEFHGESLF